MTTATDRRQGSSTRTTGHLSVDAGSPPPVVSVVIPVKDDAEVLQRCLAALDAQTRRPDEIVVVDNGSIDASAAVARRAGARVVECLSPGIPAAAAHGYDAARGRLILRLDADCVPDRRWVQTVAEAFDAHPEVDAFTGGARFVDGPRMLRAPLAAAYLLAYAAVSASALGHLPLFGSNAALRREAWLDIRASVHRHDASLHDDFDLAFHLGERHRIRFLPTAAMGMSMRPFASVSGFGRRIARGFRTVVIHWPAEFPPHRWRRLVLRSVARRRSRRERSARRGPRRCTVRG